MYLFRMFEIKAREPNEVSSLTHLKVSSLTHLKVSSLTHLKVSFGTLLNELKNLL